MGSCVSQCSSRTIRQSSRSNEQVLDTLKDSFGHSHVSVQFDEIDSGRNEISKSKIDGQSSRELYSPEPLLGDAPVFSVTESRLDGGFSASDIRDQITTEILSLRAQLVRNHALLRYLEEKVPQITSTPEKSKSKVPPISFLDARTSANSQKGSNPRIGDHKWRSQITSNQKWPLSEKPRTQSCPLICPEPTIISQSTQTQSEVEFESASTDATKKTVEKELLPEASVETTKKMICGQCEFYSFKEDSQSPQFPRHRTNSFLAAVNSSKMNVNDKDGSDENLENFVQAVEAEVCNSNREYLLPRKLPILLEEDNKGDSNTRSMNNSSRRFSSCQTQTLTPDFSDELRVPVTKELGLSNQQPQSINIIAQVIQKRTAFSEELPQDAIRYPPPYRITKSFRHRSSENVSKELLMQKPEFLRWATMSESLSAKYEDMKSGTCLKTKTTNFGTRHLSLEKQESDASSCEPGWCTQSPFPSIVKVSSSVVKPNVHPDDSIPASLQKNRVRILEQQKISYSQGTEKSDIRTGKEEEKKSYSTGLKEDKNDKGKSGKLPQRSARRGSGAGSPTSLTSIPRCPAFDFSEDEHTECDISHDKKTGTSQKVSIVDEKLTSSFPVKSPDPPSSHSSQKKRECSTSKMLAPEAVENSETESAKGSFEYEPAEAPPSTEQTLTPESRKEQQSAVPESEYVFPSLPDTVLHKLGISNESVSPVESLTAEQLEAKVVTLALGFKADMMTLDGRVSLLKHNRDLAEKDVENEMNQLKESLNALQFSATDSSTRDMISELQNHVDILCNAIAKISNRSETYGAVKQEKRVNRAFSVMLLHAEGLKRMFDREHKELEETKKLLSDTKAPGRERSTLEERKRTLKTFGIAVGSIKSLRKPILKISES